MNAAVAIAVLCTVIMTGLTVRREIGSARAASRSQPRPDRIVGNWAEIVGSGNRIGAKSAGAVLVEFADFECPACRSMAPTIERVIEKHGGRVALVHRHFPLPYHRFATKAAIAVECAGRVGQFPEMHHHLYQSSDSIGLLSFSTFALRAGISDTVAFNECLADPSVAARVSSDVDLGKSLEISGTPTFVLNGSLIAAPPSPAQLEARISALLAK